MRVGRAETKRFQRAEYLSLRKRKIRTVQQSQPAMADARIRAQCAQPS